MSAKVGFFKNTCIRSYIYWCINGGSGAYEKALKYSKHRIAFNNPINHFQSTSFKLADMATKIEASKLLVYHAAG